MNGYSYPSFGYGAGVIIRKLGVTVIICWVLGGAWYLLESQPALACVFTGLRG